MDTIFETLMTLIYPQRIQYRIDAITRTHYKVPMHANSLKEMFHTDSTLEYTVTRSDNCQRPVKKKWRLAATAKGGNHSRVTQTNPLRKPIITPAYEREICRSPKVATASDVDPVGETGLVDVEAVDPVVAAGKVVVVV